jgi:hypothetical protein
LQRSKSAGPYLQVRKRTHTLVKKVEKQLANGKNIIHLCFSVRAEEGRKNSPSAIFGTAT